LQEGYYGRSHNSLAVVLRLGFKAQIPEVTSAAGFHESFSRAKARTGILTLPELDEKVLSFLKLPGIGADKDKADKTGATPLIHAAGSGHVDAVRLLVEAGADKDKVETDHGMSALHWAAYNGDSEMTRILIEAGADRSIYESHNEMTALQLAMDEEHTEVVALFD
jgi:hypothetical protein